MADTPSAKAPAATPAESGGGEQRADPYLKSMLLGLIEDSYLQTRTFPQFATEVLKVIAYAATVPVAFTEGFLKTYLSIDRIEVHDDDHIKIVPRKDASAEDMMREVDEITAEVDPSAVFNPVVRSRLDAVHETSSRAMKYDLNQLATMSDDQLMDVLRQMQKESEEMTPRRSPPPRPRRPRARLHPGQARDDPPQRAHLPDPAAAQRQGHRRGPDRVRQAGR